MASIIVPPPVKPSGKVRTSWGGRKYFTIHVHPNMAFTIRMNEESNTAIVGFKNPDNALLTGKMIEAYYMKANEWPDTTGRIILPQPHGGDDLAFLFLRQWDAKELELTCTKNFLNMVSVENVENTKTGFNFEGQMYSFEATQEFYINGLNEMYERQGPTLDP
jgi:hypothetical protein